MQDQVVETYSNLVSGILACCLFSLTVSLSQLDKFAGNDKAKLEGMTPEERDHEPATFRFACTAERADGSFLGIRFVTGTVRTRTRSGRDPRNADLPILPPLKVVLDQAEEGESADSTDSSMARDVKLLERITKAFVKNEEWAQRAEEAFETARRDGSNENWALMHACRKKGVDEKVLLGGRHGAAFVYGVAVPGESTDPFLSSKSR
jgi:hypothetical protein